MPAACVDDFAEFPEIVRLRNRGSNTPRNLSHSAVKDLGVFGMFREIGKRVDRSVHLRRSRLAGLDALKQFTPGPPHKLQRAHACQIAHRVWGLTAKALGERR